MIGKQTLRLILQSLIIVGLGLISVRVYSIVRATEEFSAGVNQNNAAQVEHALSTQVVNEYALDSELWEAVTKGETQIVSSILAYKPELRGHTDYGNTILNVAVHSSNPKIVQLLLNYKKVINPKRPPLSTATFWGRPEMVRLLLDNHFGVDDRDADNLTPLMNAIIGLGDDASALQCATVLIKHGADVNARDGDGSTPLMLAIKARRTGVVRLLLRYHARLDVINNEGDSPTSLAGLHPGGVIDRLITAAR